MKPLNIIVTGGAGFLGTHLCRALDKEGHNVTVIDLKETFEHKSIVADVRDADAMREHITADTDLVFHLASKIEAGESVEKPQKYIDHNITGTLNVLEAMRENGVDSFIFSSSAAVYGEPLEVPIHEDDRTMPINPYGMTKLAMEALLSSYVDSHEFHGVALRYFNLYGPEEHHEPETHAIPRFIQQISNDEEVTIWGEGQHQRDYIYIDDIVDAHLKALHYLFEPVLDSDASYDGDQSKKRRDPGYYYYNLSTENPTSVLEVVETIAHEMTKIPNITHYPPRPGDPLVLTADASKARQELGWEAQVSFEEGIAKTVAYFKDFQTNSD